jgi:hypothetical protein
MTETNFCKTERNHRQGSNMSDRIARLSAWLWWTGAVLAWVLPAALALAVLRAWTDPAAIRAAVPGLAADLTATPLRAALAAATGLLSVIPLVFACRALQRLAGRYRQGEILTADCAADIGTLGRLLLLAAAATVAVPSLWRLVLTWAAPSGTQISLGLDGGTLGFLLAGALLTVIGAIMQEAARLREESEGFV